MKMTLVGEMIMMNYPGVEISIDVLKKQLSMTDEEFDREMGKMESGYTILTCDGKVKISRKVAS
jgi:hypothetical protein